MAIIFHASVRHHKYADADVVYNIRGCRHPPERRADHDFPPIPLLVSFCKSSVGVVQVRVRLYLRHSCGTVE